MPQQPPSVFSGSLASQLVLAEGVGSLSLVVVVVPPPQQLLVASHD